jgi:glycosyltransferase involved in cell wall biosynthesis
VSNFSKKDIAANLKIPEYKFSVLYNGVSNCFKCLNLEKQKIILSVATLHPCKNIKSLIKAFISLKANYKEFQGYKLVLVGEINSRIFKNSHVISLINNRKDIELTGHISDRQLVILYNKAEVFVLPSKFEGFGIPPIEAMACGCPVVVSNIPALREVCEDGAYYVDPYNINSIAQGIYKVLTDENLKKSLIVNGLKRVKLFSWENTVKKLIKIINEIRDENSYNS